MRKDKGSKGTNGKVAMLTRTIIVQLEIPFKGCNMELPIILHKYRLGSYTVLNRTNPILQLMGIPLKMSYATTPRMCDKKP